MPAKLSKLEVQQFLFGSVNTEDALQSDNSSRTIETPQNKADAYMAGRLVQCTLPHRRPPETLPIWRRTNGEVCLYIRPMMGPDGDTFLYPFGTIPRLLLFWVVTEAVRTKSTRLHLGENLSEFMRSIGLDPRHGGKKSSRNALKEQVPRLFRSMLSVQQVGKQRQRWLDMSVAPEGDIWWKPERKTESGDWQGYVDLGERFFQHICLGPQPLKLSSLWNLKGSCLALDLYAYFTNRSFKAYLEDKPFTVEWTVLQAALGSEYDRERDFRAAVKEEAERIRRELPSLRVIHGVNNLTIYPCKPAIAPR